jgi:hypothetical protein
MVFEVARSLRIEYEGAFYHVTSRGNEKQAIYFQRKTIKTISVRLKN